MKISEYTRADNVVGTDLMVFERPSSGTKSIEVGKMFGESGFEAMLLSPLNRKLFYRGKNLGTNITNAQKTAIQNGSFDGMFLGDYWTINSRKWIIADFDYWYNRQKINNGGLITYHHLVAIPDKPLMNCIFYNGNNNPNTAGLFYCYGNSALLKTHLATAQSYAEQDFGAMLKDLGKRLYSGNGIRIPANDSNGSRFYIYDNSDSFSETNINTKVLIMNGAMALGYPLTGKFSINDINYGDRMDETQLALFKVKRDCLKTSDRKRYWLRDMYDQRPYIIDYDGEINYIYPNDSTIGVRPVICLGA